MNARLLLVLLPALALAACSGGTECPEGQSPGPRGNCVPIGGRDATSGTDATSSTDGAGNPDGTSNPDATDNDAGASMDATDDAGTLPDATESDAGDTDASTGMDALPTDAGPSGATITPNPFSAGRVVVGWSARHSLRVDNLSSMSVDVTVPVLSGADAGELQLSVTATAVAGVITLGPGEGFDVNIDFRPTSAGMKSASLDLSLCAAGCATSVPITGQGLTTPVSCAPLMLDLGATNPGSCANAFLACTNDSSEPERIFGASFTAGASAEYSLHPSVALPATLAGGAVLTTTVTYCPTNLGTDNTQVAVTIDHPLPAQSTQLYPVTGTGGGPDISCAPTPVDFGVVGVGQTASRRVRCQNRGTAPLLMQSAALSAGTTNELRLALSVSGATINLPNTIAAGAALDIDLGFQPTQAASHMTTLTVASNDPDSPSVAIPVSADAIDTTGCTITVAPTTLDFGAVAPGSAVTAQVRVTDTGVGGCAFDVVGIRAGSSPAFSLVTGPASYALNPGESMFIDVRFGPSAVGPASGTLDLQSSDSANPTPSVSLSGAGDAGAVSVVITPDHLDFGTMPTACALSQGKELTIYNGGLLALSLTQVTMAAGSDPGFSASGGVLPVTIPPAGTATISVQFAPAAAGSYLGRVQLGFAGAPPRYIAVSGTGAAGSSAVVDTYPPTSGELVDVLLVVDDSGSMSPYQTLLSQAASTFTARGDAAGASYNIAIVTTDGTPGITGTMRGTPHVISSTDPNRNAELSNTVTGVGINGAGVEEAFRCAATALTDPTLLTGQNSGFLRANANLVVVILSDEDDQSPSASLQYVDQLRNRSPGAPSVTFYALSGGVAGCTGINGVAAPTPRYNEAVQATGGFIESICDTSFVPAITRIADAVFTRGRQRYPLTTPPAPGSISVSVGGAVLPAVTGTIAQWYVDYRAPAVLFAPGRSPASTRGVSIAYNAFCVPATCGNHSVNAGEQCDDGNPVNTDVCPSTCYNPTCGDGFVRAGVEQCDDGNTVPGDGCNSICTIEGCGNGVQEPGEQCDNGPNNSNSIPNACRTDCRSAHCGDAVHDNGEACDDGNAIETDGCLSTCVVARCGDGFVHVGVEQCDDGNTVDTDDCHNNCTFNGAGFTVSRTNNVSFTPAGGAPLTFAPTSDDGTAIVAIGFSFPFLGTPMTNVIVSSNGLIAFDATSAQDYQNVQLPNATAPNAIIAAWWDDLNVDAAAMPLPSVTSTLSGSAPNRTRVITYHNVPHYGYGPTDPRMTMEVRLHETTGVIDVLYAPLTNPNGPTTNWSASTGWESSSGTRGTDALGCGATCAIVNWPTNARVTYTP
ncbi:MAG: choice-of-anchor D domain-containing protein [Myxococcota bacterium]